MSIQGIQNTARSLSLYLRMQEVTANNVANTNTDGFKADRLTVQQPEGVAHPVPVGWTDLQQGSFRETGRPLDLSLSGPGFLVVGTGAGERLTRGGSLRLDPQGRLTDAHGDPLLGRDGPIVVQGGVVEVQGDGTVRVDGAEAGRLRVESVDDPGLLRKEGRGRFIPGGPTRPLPDPGSTRIRQGAVEEANVDAVLAMVDLVAIQRAYAANMDALKAMDGVLGTITNEVGKV
jgi:flagellar basal body rod protein FlgG